MRNRLYAFGNAVLRAFLLLALVALWAATTPTPAKAAESGWFSARETLQRAGVGTNNPRSLPPVKIEVKVTPKPRRASARYERLICRPDQIDPRITVCEYRD